jgi:hypothetical protein
VIHGHFYQPPRENPWTGLVERESNAAPDHDWNARITRQCYAPLASIPLGDGDDPPRINAYNLLSFDVGPTLLSWLETESPATYEAILGGDRAGISRVGHGNAVAMPYHHIILPLASRRDKQLEVRWGIADFRRRFGREPAGMWLPETAVDQESLDVMAEEGIVFTVLAPHQVERAPVSGEAGRLRTSGGRSIAAFIYDGPLSHDVAFGALLKDAAGWEKALLADGARSLISLATDGETYGHHHRFGDLALGALLQKVAMRRGIRITNYAASLAEFPPLADLTLVEPSSWSCAHGVERWRGNCGCRTALDGSTQQRWRTPLRDAIDWLVGEVHGIADRNGTALPAELVPTALAALTSCGWFFDDFGGLEGRQSLRYAARAIALSGGEAPRLEAGLLHRLEGAESNDPAVGTAVRFYLERIKPEQPR